jgi:hypothetical protein
MGAAELHLCDAPQLGGAAPVALTRRALDAGAPVHVADLLGRARERGAPRLPDAAACAAFSGAASGAGRCVDPAMFEG